MDTRLYIDGQWQLPTGTEPVPVLSPATGKLLGAIADVSRAEIDAAVAAARRAFDHGPWRTTPLAERIEVLTRFSKLLKGSAGELAELICDEVGTPISWAPMGQIGTALAAARAPLVLAADYPWEETRTGAFGNSVRVRRTGSGVVAAIVPWNAPLFVSMLKIVPALVAGCTVVLKPSPDAPLAVTRLGRFAEEAGLPAGVLNIVPAGAASSEYLVCHRGVDVVSFTGSTEVGRRIGELCGREVRRCTLELGGKSAALILDDAVIDDSTVAQIVSGAFDNSGQICMALSRVLVPESHHAAWTDALGSAIAALRVGDPRDPATQIGPVISERARDRIEAQVAASAAAGAKVILGGGRPNNLPSELADGWFLEPTLVTGVTPSMRIARDELFGPVLTVLSYAEEDEAIAIANDSPYGLAGAVWTADPDHGAQVASRIVAGSVAVNSSAPMDLGSPFGGMRLSGLGREGGPEGIAEYVETQTIVLPAPARTSRT